MYMCMPVWVHAMYVLCACPERPEDGVGYPELELLTIVG